MEQRYKYNGRNQKPQQQTQASNGAQGNQGQNGNGHPQNQFREREMDEEDHFYQQQNKRRQQKVFKEYEPKQNSQDNGNQTNKNSRNQPNNRDQNRNNNNNNIQSNNNGNNGGRNNNQEYSRQQNNGNNNNNSNEFYPRNQMRQFDDSDDDDDSQSFNSRNTNGNNNTNGQNKKKRTNNKGNQNKPKKQESSDDDDYSNGKRRGGGDKKKEKDIDPNGHNPNAKIDQQYDRSKIDHFLDKKDIKFTRDKRFNIYHQKDEEYFHSSKKKNEHIETQQKIRNTNNVKHDEELNMDSILEKVDFEINLDDIFKEENLEEYDWNDLYQLFKISEKKNSLFYTKSSEGQVIFDKQEMETEIFKFFQQLARVLILTDLETSSEKKIDQRLWDIYKKKIEQSKKLKLVSTNPEDQLHIFDTKIQFLRGILKDVIDKYKQELSSEIKQKNKKRRIIANLCCYFGELIELKEKVSRVSNQPNIKNMHFAAGQYLKAISIYPFCGKFFLVLATLSYMSEDQFSAIYWCIRALYSEQSYPCKENLQEFLEINRQKCYQFIQEHNTYSKIDKRDTFKLFILHFLSYVNIVLTKIGIENMQIHAQMFEYLQQHSQYLQSLVQQQPDVNLKDQATLLTYVLMMIVFTLHKFQEFIKLKENEVLTVKILENDILASSCLKYTYGLLNMILEIYNNTESPYFVDLVIPVVCYLNSNQPVAEYLFSKYSQFQNVFNKVLLKTKQRFAEFERQKPRSFYENLCDTYLCETEIQMIGYTPFNSYFENNKDKFKLLADDSLQYPLKLFIILDKLPKIESFQILLEEEQTKNRQKEDQEDFFFVKNTPQKESKDERESKQLIIIDGMNVAIRYGQSTFCAKGLQIVVDFWLNHHAEVLVFLPDFCFSTEQIEKKRKKFQKERITDRLKTLPDEVETLIKLRDQGYATGIPNWNYDDSYMIDYARKKDAFIMTNDRYNDHIQQFKNDPKQMEIVKQWIRNNCMSFTFVKEQLLPDPDFIQKRTKISLERFQQ